MNVKQSYDTLGIYLFKLAAYDNKEDRVEVYNKAIALIKELETSHNAALDGFNEVSKKILPIIAKKNEAERHVAYLEIALGKDNLHKANQIISRMEKAVEYEKSLKSKREE